MDIIQSVRRVRTEQDRKRIYEDFVHAQIVRLYMFPTNPGDEPPYPWDYYPELFGKEKDQYLESMEQKDLENLKQKRRAYYKEFNDRMGQQ